jgi:hypothetical protein
VAQPISFGKSRRDNKRNSRKYPDESCTICYPPNQPLDFFINFWQWFKTEFSTISYSGLTQFYFYNLITNDSLAKQHSIIQKLIFTIRYTKPLSIDNIFVKLTIALRTFDLFTKKPFEYYLDQDNICIPISGYSTPQSAYTFKYQTDLLFINEDLALETLFELPNLQHQENTMADADDVLNYLKSNMNQNIIRVEPFYGDGTQDPISWLTAFDKASRVNNWRDEKLIRMLNGHLLDEAEEWWSNYYEVK